MQWRYRASQQRRKNISRNRLQKTQTEAGPRLTPGEQSVDSEETAGGLPEDSGRVSTAETHFLSVSLLKRRAEAIKEEMGEEGKLRGLVF